MKKFLKIIIGILTVFFVAVGVFIAFSWAPDRPVTELTARWAPPPSVFIKVKGMDVHLRDEGPKDDSTPIVLLHGTSSSLHTWEGWTQKLKEKHRVIRFDLPGFGLTGPTPDNDYTLENYTRFVIAMLDALNVKQCIMAGNSFGGSVSLSTALAQPQRVKKLILVDSGGYVFQSTSVPIGFRIARLPVLNRLAQNILPRFLIESSIKNVYGDPSKVTPELIDLYFDITVRKGNRRTLVEQFKQTSLNKLSSRISEIHMPTLILWGGKDRLIPPNLANRFHSDISGSQLVIFNDLGHVPQEEDPYQTVMAVEHFITPN